MYISIMARDVKTFNEDRFRTPLERERELGLWVDRIGCRRRDTLKFPCLRILGQYSTVSIEAGEGILETMNQGTHVVRTGDVIMLYPQEPESHFPKGKWDMRWVVWNGPEAAVLEKLSGLNPAVPVIKGAAPAVLRAWQQLDPLMERQDFDAVLSRKVVILNLIRELSWLRAAEKHLADPLFMAAALRELSRTDGSSAAVAELAQRLHVSPAHFRRLFKAHIGTSPKAFQVAQRINRAKELLAEGVSIKETAATLGFSDVFHFMRRFRKVTGYTAGQFTSAFARDEWSKRQT
jgi:AraC-like DNA-binding protein